eukprot:1188069-Prorocentrum_minimum.AAC.1
MSFAARAASFWNHPAGPKTIFFWAPTMKWGITAANINDFSRPVEGISYPQQLGKQPSNVVSGPAEPLPLNVEQCQHDCLATPCASLSPSPGPSGHAIALSSHRRSLLGPRRLTRRVARDIIVSSGFLNIFCNARDYGSVWCALTPGLRWAGQLQSDVGQRGDGGDRHVSALSQTQVRANSSP